MKKAVVFIFLLCGVITVGAGEKHTQEESENFRSRDERKNNDSIDSRDFDTMTLPHQDPDWKSKYRNTQDLPRPEISCYNYGPAFLPPV